MEAFFDQTDFEIISCRFVFGLLKQTFIKKTYSNNFFIYLKMEFNSVQPSLICIFCKATIRFLGMPAKRYENHLCKYFCTRLKHSFTL